MHFAIARRARSTSRRSFGRDFANTVSKMITRPGAIQ